MLYIVKTLLNLSEQMPVLPDWSQGTPSFQFLELHICILLVGTNPRACTLEYALLWISSGKKIKLSFKIPNSERYLNNKDFMYIAYRQCMMQNTFSRPRRVKHYSCSKVCACLTVDFLPYLTERPDTMIRFPHYPSHKGRDHHQTARLRALYSCVS